METEKDTRGLFLITKDIYMDVKNCVQSQIPNKFCTPPQTSKLISSTNTIGNISEHYILEKYTVCVTVEDDFVDEDYLGKLIFKGDSSPPSQLF